MLLALFLVSSAVAVVLAVAWGRVLLGNRPRDKPFVPPPAHYPMRIPPHGRLARGTTPPPVDDDTPVEPLAVRIPPPRAISAVELPPARHPIHRDR